MKKPAPQGSRSVDEVVRPHRLAADPRKINYRKARAERERLLARLRCIKLRIRLLELEVDEVGVWLVHGIITPVGAVRWLDDLALDVLGWLPECPADEEIEVLP
jgi:hypothetical protein